MNSDAESGSDTMMCCASCGVTASDNIKLKDCSACKLVKYCGIKCQREHRPQHKRDCKKRAAELRDERLFKQPESTHLGDCPICCLPISHGPGQSDMFPCCGKMICIGCAYSNQKRELEGKLQLKCPFCRHPMSKTQAENERTLLKRAETGDAAALSQMSGFCIRRGDFKSTFEYWSKAVALGNVGSHYDLSLLYQMGKGVEKDDKKQLYHMEQATIGGHPHARHHLGYVEAKNGRADRAVKHFVIAAHLGHEKSMEALKNAYAKGAVSKEDFAAALRAYQAAV